MNQNKINRAIELQMMINELTEELDTIKAELRNEANGETVAYKGVGGVITVSKPGKDSVVFDAKAYEIKAPKAYAEALAKYNKVRKGTAPSVKIILDK